MNISQQVIILSAEKDSISKEENQKRTDILKGCLSDCNLRFDEGTGVFNNGPEEKSLVVIVNDEDEIQAVKDFAFQNFNQDAIVLQDVNQEAHLINNDGTELALGRLELVSKAFAIDKGNYTLLNGKYYATKPRK